MEVETFDRCLSGKTYMPFLLGIIAACMICFFVLTKKHSSHPLLTEPITKLEKSKLKSPFYRTLGFIRWNSAHLERIPVMEKYRPFFYDLHYSIPNYMKQLNLTGDGWENSDVAYKALAETMQIVLQKNSTIEGVLYFHFDVRISDKLYTQSNSIYIWRRG
jgi:hypothetical protein